MITYKNNQPWKISFYSQKTEAQISSLPVGIKANLIKILELIEEFGPNLGKPYTASMGNGLFEIRAKGKEGICRVFYCVVIEREIVLLQLFYQKKSKDTQKRV